MKRENCKNIFFGNNTLIFTVIVSVLVSLAMLYMFVIHKRDYGWQYAVDTGAVGQYGDFIGGVIGTLLSVYLLYRTLILQQKDSKEIYKTQQLNDEFFHLLDIYNNIVSTLSSIGDDVFYEGKEALHKSYENLYEGFDRTTHISQRRKVAADSYLDFYSRERDFAPVYFRTLYRICEIIDSNDCPENKKVEYVKILRAQFTDTELIFLRYNAMTPLGGKFTKYINKYNLLKHIPIFLLLEYKEWSYNLGIAEKFKLSSLFQQFREIMADMLNPSKNVPLTNVLNSSKGKYNVMIECNKERTQLVFTFTRNTKQKINESDSFFHFDRLGKEQIFPLLRYYMKDCFVLNSFNKLNNRQDLILDYEDESKDEMEKIKLIVENKIGNALKL